MNSITQAHADNDATTANYATEKDPIDSLPGSETANHKDEQSVSFESASVSNDTIKAIATSNSPAATYDEGKDQILNQFKERNSRMEMLLNKKNTRIQELEDTVMSHCLYESAIDYANNVCVLKESKLKRLLAMAKRSIDNSKHEVSEKDGLIKELEAEKAQWKNQMRDNWDVDTSTPVPRRILIKISQGDWIWCLIEYETESETVSSFGWHRFSSDSHLESYTSRVCGEPIHVPPLLLLPNQVSQMQKQLKQDLEQVQEEFRRYRVRAEITRKQKDSEIRKIQADAMSSQSQQLSGTDLQCELEATRLQLRRSLTKQSEAEAQATKWRFKAEKLATDYEKLSGAMGETTLATEWRERYEQLIAQKDALAKQIERLEASSAHPAHALGEMHPVDSRRTNSSSWLPMARTRRLSSGSSTISAFEPPNATTTNEYLKNIVYRYLTTEQLEAKEHMEKAITTVLNFSSCELEAIQKRKQQGWFW
ncbi:unnamed protein product [Albugo candida]|uniref:GRIP domain-containing protein n=1 Tax=Albugo candida TaxID=65357 RepID=A0A024GMF9_9STRA|nr:unnamed protein product [Albugo candida]|eukprot:CCI48071.1 unnamed protein product [Albugo candida]